MDGTLLIETNSNYLLNGQLELRGAKALEQFASAKLTGPCRGQPMTLAS